MYDFIINCAIEREAITRSVETFHKWNEDIVTAKELEDLEVWTDAILKKNGLTREEWFQNAQS